MNRSDYPLIRQASENSILIYLAATADPKVLTQIQWLTNQLRLHLGALLQNIVPSYNSILLVYDFLLLDQTQLQLCITDLLAQLNDIETDRLEPLNAMAGRIIELPCYYSSESGPDLTIVAKQHGLTVPEVIKRHSNQLYQVYAIGFAPGFAYLGWVDDSIATARLKTPRLKVPAGSVAIADRQTAVYPSLSPGGWNLIGNCPIALFDLNREPVMPLSIGDAVRFIPIERAEYLHLGGC